MSRTIRVLVAVLVLGSAAGCIIAGPGYDGQQGPPGHQGRGGYQTGPGPQGPQGFPGAPPSGQPVQPPPPGVIIVP